jgi:HD-like signal output (HDOD) protein
MLLDAEGRLLGKHVDHWIMPSKWLAIITQCERTVGLAVTKAWTLPDSVIDAVGQCESYDEERPFRLANVVRLANALAASAGHDLSTRPAEETSAIVEGGAGLLGLDADTIAGVTAALPARLAGRMA